MKLADKIKAIPLPQSDYGLAFFDEGGMHEANGAGYTEADIRHIVVKAAELATAHDALMQQMAEALEQGLKCGEEEWGHLSSASNGKRWLTEAAAALRAYKEQP